MSKVEQERALHTQISLGQAVAEEAVADVPDVFTLPPLSQARRMVRIVKVQPAPFAYIADNASSGDDEE